MPPPQRIPSLPGATQASKKAFKPPARVISSDSNPGSSSAAARATSRPAASIRANRANPSEATRSVSATSDRSGPSTTQGGKASTTKGKTASMSGFKRAADLHDIDMISSDDDDDFNFDDAAQRPLPTKAITQKAAPPPKIARTTAKATNKGKGLARLPSLSPDSSLASPTRESSPIALDEIDSGREETTTNAHEGENDVSKIGTDEDEVPLLPGLLLTRLLYECFEDKEVKISKDANSLMARYMDLFVREAVARATEVQKERKTEEGHVVDDGDMDDDRPFLITKDLEEVAPGLVLDF
ncbi:hypothetical protein AAFC00_000224 [Neodothiora populina]|uniref:Uncharacterized protein n=1 Tax=Neodothiora populina TaxID=2781224 RepID=A0ABR3P1T8_9PEZI